MLYGGDATSSTMENWVSDVITTGSYAWHTHSESQGTQPWAWPGNLDWRQAYPQHTFELVIWTVMVICTVIAGGSSGTSVACNREREKKQSRVTQLQTTENNSSTGYCMPHAPSQPGCHSTDHRSRSQICRSLIMHPWWTIENTESTCHQLGRTLRHPRG